MKNFGRKMKIFLILIIATICSVSQPWMEGLTEEEKNNFFAIQKSFYEYMEDKSSTQKGIGYKQFKRWEWFWESRVLEDGRFPSRENFQQARNQINKAKKTKLNSTNEWKTLGPDDSPGGYEGLGRINVVRAESDNNDRLWAGAASGGLWFSSDAGISWECKSDNVDVFEVLGVSDIAFDPNNKDIIYIASGDRDAADTYSSGLLKSTDGGDTWFKTDLAYNVENSRVRLNRILINPNDPDSIFVGGSNGIWLTTNAGDSWTRVRSGVHILDMEMKPDDPNTIYATDFSHRIHYTRNAGSSWDTFTNNNLPTSGVNRTAIAVTRDDPEYLVALMSASHSGLYGVYRSNDAGNSWIQIASDDPNMLHWSQNTDDTGGQGWFDLCVAIDPTDKDNIFIGGVNTWHTTDGGVNWEISTMWHGGTPHPTVHADQHDLWFTDDGTRLLIGNDGGVYKTDDNGNNYDWIGRGKNTTQFYRIAVSQQTLDMVIGGSQDNGTKLRTTEWDHVLGGDGMECLIYPDDDNIVMGASQNGNIFKSLNGGENFRRINSSGNGYDDIDEEGAWITPYAISPTDTSQMLVGMGDMWRSSDGGDTFVGDSIGQNTKWRFIEYSPAASNIVYAATNSQLWYSANGGQSWVQRSRPGNQAITSIEPHPTDPDIIYATNGNWNANNKVFRSTDRGQNWTNLSSGLPNLPANCVFYQEDSDNRIYVGTDIGVYYRDDNSNGWVELNDGLPNTIVTDIEMNYENEIMYAGTYGRGVWYYDINPHLDPPTLNSIADNSTGQELDDIVLTWNPVNNATKYTIQVSTEAGFSALIVNESDYLQTSYTLSDLENFTEYFWRVKAVNDFVESDWSIPFKFRTILDNPVLEFPNDEAIGRPLTLKLDWAGVSGAESYDLELATDIAFNDKLIEIEIDDSEYQVELLDGLNYFETYFWRVKAKRSDEESIWSITREFQTIIGKVSLSSPENDFLDQSLTGKLAWEALNGAENYDLEISISEDFSTVETSESAINGLEYEFSGLDFETEYFWRVRGSYFGGKGAWSNPFSFMTVLQPLELVEMENRYSNDIYLELSWLPVGTQDSYTIQVSEDAQFSGGDMIIVNIDGDETSEMVDLNFNTNYFARIRRNVDTRSSAWSDFIEFTTELNKAELLIPENDKIDFTNQDKFEWREVLDAEHYELQVSTQAAFNNDLIYDIEVSSTEFSPAGLNSGEKYYWRVRGVSFDGNNFGDWSEVRSITTKYGTPNLLAPDNNSKFTESNLTLSWQEFQNADSYLLEVSLDSDFTSSQLVEVNDIQYELTNLSLGTYFWRIKAKIGLAESDWSAIWKFTIQKEATAPGKPVLVAPANNETDLTFNSIYFDWDDVPNALTYEIQISEDSQFNDMFTANNDLQSSNATIENFDSDKQYWWRVRANNDVGGSEYSDVWTFKTIENIPSEGWSLISPPNNSKGIEYKETEFVWHKFSENSIYEFSISDGENGNILISAPEHSDTTYSTKLQADTRYCWKVTAVDTEDNSTDEMEWCFTTKQPASVLGTKDGNLFKLYPNPADNVIHLESKNAELIISYIIFDINGNEILRAENLNSRELQMNTQKLNNGKYLIRFDTKSGNYQMNFTISK